MSTSALLYFALWAGLIFLMMRFGCGAHVMGHGHAEHKDHGGPSGDEGNKAQRTPPETDVDPVCRMSVRTDGAKSSVYRGRVYYFCSAQHRDAFEAEPARYVGAQAGNEPQPMEHHHG
jgi:YHS domain-containing protein